MPKTADELLQVVRIGRDMRAAQRSYFKARSAGVNASAALSECKKLESQFDRLVGWALGDPQAAGLFDEPGETPCA